jgi:hypothetical protein
MAKLVLFLLAMAAVMAGVFLTSYVSMVYAWGVDVKSWPVLIMTWGATLVLMALPEFLKTFLKD